MNDSCELTHNKSLRIPEVTIDEPMVWLYDEGEVPGVTPDVSVHDVLQHLSPAHHTPVVLIHPHHAQRLELDVETLVALVAALECDTGARRLVDTQG